MPPPKTTIAILPSRLSTVPVLVSPLMRTVSPLSIGNSRWTVGLSRPASSAAKPSRPAASRGAPCDCGCARPWPGSPRRSSRRGPSPASPSTGQASPCQSALKLGELLADLARFLFLGLVLADLADVVFSMRLLLSLISSSAWARARARISALLHVLHHRLVFLQPLLQFLLAGVDGLPLRLPVALVAPDVLQVLVALDIV